MNLTVLGSQGAIPKVGKFCSSFVLDISNTKILIDCCEGAQFQLRKNKIRLNKIEIILISHAHGDHYFGLIGLLSTLSLMKRNKSLIIFCPDSVNKIIKSIIKYSKLKFSYNLNINILKNHRVTKIYENDLFFINAFPLNHSIYTNGFLIKEKIKKRKLIMSEVLKKNIDKIYFNKLTKGLNVFNKDNVEINYKEVTEEGLKPKSFAYCSDTAYSDKLIKYVKDVDLLYCETTFLNRDKEKATLTYHSTTVDAAKLALKANVKKLLIGHFSSRYEWYDEFLEEVKIIFRNVMLSEEGKKIEL